MFLLFFVAKSWCGIVCINGDAEARFYNKILAEIDRIHLNNNVFIIGSTKTKNSVNLALVQRSKKIKNYSFLRVITIFFVFIRSF